MFPLLFGQGKMQRVDINTIVGTQTLEVMLDDILVGYTFIESNVRKYSSVRPVSVSDLQLIYDRLSII
jgi:hypothetical protein